MNEQQLEQLLDDIATGVATDVTEYIFSNHNNNGMTYNQIFQEVLLTVQISISNIRGYNG